MSPPPNHSNGGRRWGTYQKTGLLDHQRTRSSAASGRGRVKPNLTYPLNEREPT